MAIAVMTWPAFSSSRLENPTTSAAMRSLAMLSLRFLQDALDSQGRCRNRMNRFGVWEDSPAVDDSWGRTIWGLGTAVSQSDDHLIRHLAGRGLERAMTQRSPWPRAMAFAALGAAEVLQVDPGNLDRQRSPVGRRRRHDRAPSAWFVAMARRRLTYANATLPEAMIAAGSALGIPLLTGAVVWSSWSGCSPGRLDTATSPSPQSGAAVPMTRVLDSTNSRSRWPLWRMPVPAPKRWTATSSGWTGSQRPLNWFLGDNDNGVVMWDPEPVAPLMASKRHSANLNQGTESTLALLSTLQHARSQLSVLQ